jgi:hypothetical protein
MIGLVLHLLVRAAPATLVFTSVVTMLVVLAIVFSLIPMITLRLMLCMDTLGGFGWKRGVHGLFQ